MRAAIGDAREQQRRAAAASAPASAPARRSFTLFRACWWQRKLASVPPALLRHVRVDSDGLLSMLPSAQHDSHDAAARVRAFDVVVCTCGAAGALAVQGLRGHFCLLYTSPSPRD